eukprot:g17369.t1
MAARHWAFVAECLHDLRAHLHALGQPLIVRTGDVLDVLDQFHSSHRFAALWSHEETGNAWTYTRDKRVAAWCRKMGLPWHEVQQNGTQRRLKTRNGWAKAWDSFMAEPVTKQPALEPLSDIPLGTIPTAAELGLKPDACPERQKGGREPALERLHTFLHERGEPYRRAMSNPLTGADACSRLSPYLAWGSVSMREVTQITWTRQRVLKEAPKGSTGGWRGALTSFSGRLHWHCHFIQKLEDEPDLEWQNLHPVYNGMRPAEPDADRLKAWESGQSGLPFVDACMRSLAATGWLNFRMRAMVMAVASYHLWLDWRKPGEHLARQFTDYEPGIHWPQVQMQSGTTGINTIRIYNPVKQGHDQDPDGLFVRRWVPELAAIEDRFLQEPWKAENAGAVLGKAYPFPIVDHLTAAKDARQRIWARAPALARLQAFAPRTGRAYAARRNYDLGPDNRSNISCLSPWIRHRLLLEEEVLRDTLARHSLSGAEKFIQEVFWRGYFKGWLEQRPSVWRSYRADVPRLLDELDTSTEQRSLYEAATAGGTGIDAFDAWSTELVETGYLHNHARMWFASIWIFTLRLPWQLGADFFYRHLLDGDPASNTLSWRWVAGLHTKGKTYLARRSNIERYTGGRFSPVGLAGEAPPLTEPMDHPLQPLPHAARLKNDEPFALILTEEDCHSESLPLPHHPVGVCHLGPTDWRSPLATGEPARHFVAEALEDAAERARSHFNCDILAIRQNGEQNQVERLVDWARALNVRTLVTAWAPTGPVREKLDALQPALEQAGLRLAQIRRPYDEACWPHATKGFFALKTKIPSLIKCLDLA